MSPEIKIGIFALVGLALFGCWRLFQWFRGAPSTPNPWDEKTEESLHQPDATPLCSRCLEPHHTEARFCPNCGAPVDPLVAFSPYLYVFAFGDMLRAGTTRPFRANWMTVIGFLLLPIAFVPFILVFVYWFFFLRNLARNPPAQTTSLDTEARDNSSAPD
jgi:hypothetical protein